MMKAEKKKGARCIFRETTPYKRPGISVRLTTIEPRDLD